MPSFGQLMAMVARSVQSPREGAAEVLAMGVPRAALWPIVILVAILSAIMTQLNLMLTRAELPEPLLSIASAPVWMSVVQFATLALMIGAVYAIGRAMGGTGSLPETALLLSWLQFILVCLNAAQLVAGVILPPFGALVGLAVSILGLWLLVNFIAALHGFRSLFLVFVMLVVAFLSIIFLMSLVLILFGIGPTMPAGDI